MAATPKPCRKPFGLFCGPSGIFARAMTPLTRRQLWVRVQNFLGSTLLQPLADNGNMVINALDNMCGSQDLISLRSRGEYRRPFEKKRELEREADERFRAEEQALQARLEDTERKLNELQVTQDGSGRLILSPEQQAEIEAFRTEQVETRKKLRVRTYNTPERHSPVYLEIKRKFGRKGLKERLQNFAKERK